MGFEEILDAWEKKQTDRREAKNTDMERMLSRYPPGGHKEEDIRAEREADRNRHSAPARSGRGDPQAVLDLHGMNSREAEQALERFILAARRRGLRKVLIVHGKGHHSSGEPILQGVVRDFLEKCRYTGAFGPAARKHGGRGATWVNVRDS